MPDESRKSPAHKHPARTFRLGPDADAHIAEIAAHLSVLTGAPATDTAAVRYALAEAAKKVRKNNSGKTAN
ncbi:MAG: hypothetical protein E6Q76_02210 [Rhizobium sp.]|nr:MAG: hypothetical protein E6Q76_02210 [Rhizobium sp.]